MNKSSEERIAQMCFATIYPLYLQKVQRKGRTKDELDSVLCWLTGHTLDSLELCCADTSLTLADFFAQSPGLNSKMLLIKGSICGYRLQELGVGLLRQVRCMDKLVDDLAKGRILERILPA